MKKKDIIINLAILAGIYFAIKAVAKAQTAAAAPSSYASRSSEYNIFTTNVDDLGVAAFPATLTLN